MMLASLLGFRQPYVSAMTDASGAPLDDAELVRRMEDGDDRALAELYDRHAGMIFGIARSILRESADAEEITEDVFLQIWRRAAAFDPTRGTVRTYLATAARSRSLDRIRSGKRRRAVVESAANEGEDGAALPIAGVEDADRRLERGEAARVAAEALELLSDDQRAAIELAYFQGLSQSEIARTLGVPLGTIKTRIRDGMARLRERFAHRVPGGVS